MKKRLAWLGVSCLTILSLILAACAPAVTEKKEEVVTKKELPKEEVVPEAKVTPALVPKYGGTVTVTLANWVYTFDESLGSQSAASDPLHLINDELLEGDWTRGPAGTGETTFGAGALWPDKGIGLGRRFPNPEAGPLVGHIAESFEIPDDSTEIFYIRKGIHFPREGAAQGRELDANDVAFSLDRLVKSKVSFHGLNYPPPMGVISVTATDKWTVVVKTYPGKAGYNMALIGDMSGIIAPEAVKKYGNLAQWEAAATAGSGPFIMTDYISGNSISFKRNPDYWQRDPFRPENQLPYVDKVKMMIIADRSTQLAALRTGKLDVHGATSGITVPREDWESLVKTNPELMWRKELKAGKGLGMRIDKPELPWFDIRVRQALFKTIDFWTILKDYYKGDAELITELAAPIIEFKELYIPLEEYPEHVQDLYKYDPKKAKELLAEAGYPNGFKAEIILTALEVDEISMIKAYWSKIGVDLELQVKEVGAFTAISNARAHSQMITSFPILYRPHPMHHWRQAPANVAYVNDPICQANYDRATSMWNINYPEYVKAVRAQLVRGQELAAYVFLPSPYSYTMWWPWVENYHGEYAMGYLSQPNYLKYIWLNPELKRETLAKR